MGWFDFLKPKQGKEAPSEVSYDEARDGIVAKALKMELALETMGDYNKEHFGGEYPDAGYDPKSFMAFTNWYEKWEAEHDGKSPTADDMWAAMSGNGIEGMTEYSDAYFKVYDVYKEEASKVDEYVAGRANGKPEPQPGTWLRGIADRFAEVGEKVDEVALNINEMDPSYSSVGYFKMLNCERWSIAYSAFDQYTKINNAKVTGKFGELDEQQKKDLEGMIDAQVTEERGSRWKGSEIIMADKEPAPMKDSPEDFVGGMRGSFRDISGGKPSYTALNGSVPRLDRDALLKSELGDVAAAGRSLSMDMDGPNA